MRKDHLNNQKILHKHLKRVSIYCYIQHIVSIGEHLLKDAESHQPFITNTEFVQTRKFA